MITSEKIDLVSEALNKAQAEMLPLVKDATNPFFKSKYADLHSVTAACYPALQKHKIAVIQSVEQDEKSLNIFTRLQHTSGQFIETCCAVPPTKADPQQFGSAITYGRRYGLQAAVGLAPQDDDGNATTHTKPVAKKKVATKAQPLKAITDIQIGSVNELLAKVNPSDEALAANCKKLSNGRTDKVLGLMSCEAAKLIGKLTTAAETKTK